MTGIHRESFRNKALKATLIAIGGNAALGALKISVGLFTSSISLVADGVDSILDLFMGIVAYVGTIYAQKPADENHQYGHEKVEMILVLALTFIIGYSGLNLALTAVDKLVQGTLLTFSPVGFFTGLLGIIGKLVIVFIMYRTSSELDSTSLKATALNYSTDVLSSSFVVIAFTSTAIHPALGFVDPIAAILICFVIFYGAGILFRNALDILQDRAPNKQDIAEILSLAGSIKGVREVHSLRARYNGKIVVGDVHVLVDPEISVRKGHTISEAVYDILHEKLGARIVVHLEPYGED
ncbi:MAG: cation diffusion facilitator family transporter [Candidatus Heimdallarchaeota archaeon]